MLIISSAPSQKQHLASVLHFASQAPTQRLSPQELLATSIKISREQHPSTMYTLQTGSCPFCRSLQWILTSSSPPSQKQQPAPVL